MPYIRLPSWGIEPSSLPEDFGARDLGYLWDLLCDPREVRAEHRDLAYAATGFGDALRRVPPELPLPLPVGTVLQLREAPDATAFVGSDDEAAMRDRFLVGIMLLWTCARSQHEETRASASLGAARRMIDAATRQRGLRGASVPKHRKIWPKYQSVAHLCAAIQIWIDNGRGFDALITARGMRQLLAIAETLRLWGEGFKPKRASAPILDPQTTWKVPPQISAAWPAFDLRCDDPNAWDLRLG